MKKILFILCHAMTLMTTLCVSASYICKEQILNICCEADQVPNLPGAEYFVDMQKGNQTDSGGFLSRPQHQYSWIPVASKENIQSASFIFIDSKNQVHLMCWYKDYNEALKRAQKNLYQRTGLGLALGTAVACGVMQREWLLKNLTFSFNKAEPTLLNPMLKGIVVGGIGMNLFDNFVDWYDKKHTDLFYHQKFSKTAKWLGSSLYNFAHFICNTKTGNPDGYLVNNAKVVSGDIHGVVKSVLEATDKAEGAENKKITALKEYIGKQGHFLIECPELNKRLTQHFEETEVLDDQIMQQWKVTFSAGDIVANSGTSWLSSWWRGRKSQAVATKCVLCNEDKHESGFVKCSVVESRLDAQMTAVKEKRHKKGGSRCSLCRKSHALGVRALLEEAPMVDNNKSIIVIRPAPKK